MFQNLADRRRRIKNSEEWLYWRPIVYGRVTIPIEYYDQAPESFLLDLNAAMDVRSELEREANERAQPTDPDLADLPE